MEEFLRNKLRDRNIVILGFGREGQATYSMLRKVFPETGLTIADSNHGIRDNSLIIHDSHLKFKTGVNYLEGLSAFDLIFRSPGIPVWKLTDPEFSDNRDLVSSEKITSQTSLFLEFFGNQVVGVTGTKGKSTTASLVAHILKGAGRDVILAGNIGNPVFNIVHLVKPETVIVVELSSHQLEYLEKAPKIAVFLNLFQEHLDAYKSYRAYQEAKLNICKFQQPGDYLVFNLDDPLVSKLVTKFLPQRNYVGFSMSEKSSNGIWLEKEEIWMNFNDHSEKVWSVHQDRFLRGEHNLKNIMAAIAVCHIYGIGYEDIEDGIATFKGLEHRLEYVGKSGGIHFYNDSIATIPEACMEAVKSVPLVDTLIAGGFDRGIDYSELGRFLAGSEVKNFILTGAAGKRIGECMKLHDIKDKKIFFINRFDDFVLIASQMTRRDHACLLSPAAASYDEFKNFEERGKRFRFLVQNLKFNESDV